MESYQREINECLRIAGVQLKESDNQYNNIEEIKELMTEFEAAQRDYHIADYYDDNYSWRNAQNNAQRRKDEANKKLIELTGKDYWELKKEFSKEG